MSGLDCVSQGWIANVVRRQGHSTRAGGAESTGPQKPTQCRACPIATTTVRGQRRASAWGYYTGGGGDPGGGRMHACASLRFATLPEPIGSKMVPLMRMFLCTLLEASTLTRLRGGGWIAMTNLRTGGQRSHRHLCIDAAVITGVDPIKHHKQLKIFPQVRKQNAELRARDVVLAQSCLRTRLRDVQKHPPRKPHPIPSHPRR